MAVKNEIRKSFNRYAADYEMAAKVQQEIGKRLLERLSYLKITPKYILDLGCGPGTFSRELLRLFPKAQVVGLDLAQGMLLQAQQKQGWWHKWPLVAADMQQMPFASGVFDLVFANQVVHWATPLARIFQEINRVMRVDGCLMFTTLGPDTFKELKKAWSTVDPHAHVNEFVDMHDIGDCLMKEYFVDPVMDMELLAIHYASLPALLKALKTQGVKNIHAARNRGLTGKAAWQQFEKNYALLQTPNGKYPLSYEVVYGHAWKGGQQKTDRGLETLIPVSQIVRRG